MIEHVVTSPRPSRSPRPLLALVLSLAFGCSHPGVRPDGAVGPLTSGAAAPEVVGIDAAGHEVRLTAQRGHPVVVYFYPKDGTPGCTREACAFRDTWAQFVQAQVVVIGVSGDSARSHQAFLSEQKIPFALAADEDGAIASAYGVGKGTFGYERVTFLVDGSGRVARYWPDVDPGVHAKEVLAAALALPGGSGQDQGTRTATTAAR